MGVLIVKGKQPDRAQEPTASAASSLLQNTFLRAHLALETGMSLHTCTAQLCDLIPLPQKEDCLASY